MKKKSTKIIKDEFTVAIDSCIRQYERLEASRPTDSEKNLQAEQVFLTATTRWEGFLATLLPAYVNKDSSQACASIQVDVTNSARSKYGAAVGDVMKIMLPRHLTAEQSSQLLDPEGFNPSFKDGPTLREKANRWIAKPHRNGIDGLTAADLATITSWTKIRNYLAHHSSKAFKEMNTAIDDGNLRSDHPELARSTNLVKNVGSFLKRVPVGHKEARLLHYLKHMKLIAGAI